MTDLGPLPSGYVATRDALHRLAVYVISPAQRLANGEIIMRSAPGGVGTWSFGDDGTVVRVDGAELVVERGGAGSARAPITSLSAAGALVGVPPDVAQQEQFDVPPHGDLDEDLAVDGASAGALADWYAFAWDVLGEMRSEARPSDDVTDVRLWPEHFDAAIDLGSQDAGLRGTYGASPGDRFSDEPYLYATVWAGPPEDPFWNAEGFRGAWLRHSDLRASGDPRGAALGFFREARGRVLGY